MRHIATVHNRIVNGDLSPGQQLRQQKCTLRSTLSAVQPATVVFLHICFDLPCLIGKGGESAAALVEAIHGSKNQPVVLRE